GVSACGCFTPYPCWNNRSPLPKWHWPAAMSQFRHLSAPSASSLAARPGSFSRSKAQRSKLVSLTSCLFRFSSHILQVSSKKESAMSTGTVFENNRTQAVRLPVDVRFEEGVKKVRVRKLGKERILTPVNHTWDSFFHAEE